MGSTVVGDYLKRVPLDPFDGQPLRYRRDPEGVVIYSVGLDGQDGGGILAMPNTIKEGTDQGIRLYDLNQRGRQQP